MSAREITPLDPGMSILMCSWFASCDRDAAVYVTHPILGLVPTCTRCVQRILDAS